MKDLTEKIKKTCSKEFGIYSIVVKNNTDYFLWNGISESWKDAIVNASHKAENKYSFDLSVIKKWTPIMKERVLFSDIVPDLENFLKEKEEIGEMFKPEEEITEIKVEEKSISKKEKEYNEKQAIMKDIIDTKDKKKFRDNIGIFNKFEIQLLTDELKIKKSIKSSNK